MRKFFLKLRKRPHLDRDLDEEFAFHCERSDRSFGNVTRLREEARELWTFPLVESWFRDLRLACRVLAKSPSFSLVCLLTLGGGLGLNTTVFTLYDALTFRLLPVRAPQELVRVVRQSGEALQPTRVSYSEWTKLQKGLATVADVMATSSSQTIPGAFTPSSEPQEGINAQLVTGNYFAVLGIPCHPGRAFSREESAVAVVSHAYWTRRLQANPAILGQFIQLGSVRFQIVGVAPPGFYGTDLPPRMPDLWIPLTTPSRLLWGDDGVQDRQALSLQVLARRKPGVTVRQVSQALRRIGSMTRFSDGQTSELAAVNATAFQTNLGGFRGTGTIAFILLGAVGAILLIGCINLINLTLSRHAARRREIAVRLALGASRRQVIQQLCAESLILSFGGGVIGLGLSLLLCWGLQRSVFTALDQISHELVDGFQLNVAPDWRVFAYTLVLSVFTAALIGVWPALASTRTHLSSSLKTEGLLQNQRRFLLTAQIAASVILLAGAGLLFRGAWQAHVTNPGFSMDHVLLLNADLTMVDGSDEARRALLQRVLDRTRSLPEVAHLALMDRAPFLGTGSSHFESEDHRSLQCRFNVVSDGYFDTLGVPILAGRGFSSTEAEQADAKVIVSEAAARLYWPDQNPIGRRLFVSPGSRNGLPHLVYTVIGVAKVVRSTFLSKVDHYYLYFPKPVSAAGGWMLVRTRHSPEDMIPILRQAVRQIHPSLASHVYLITLEKGPVQVQKLLTEVPGTVALLLGVLALFLASLGVYGLVTYLVAQRIRVIGIHLALGAQRRDVIGLILRESLGCVVRGAGMGFAGAACLSALLAALVKTPDLPDLTYQAGVFDPATFLITLAALGFTVAVACVRPVYQATRVDPIIALRDN